MMLTKILTKLRNLPDVTSAEYSTRGIFEVNVDNHLLKTDDVETVRSAIASITTDGTTQTLENLDLFIENYKVFERICEILAQIGDVSVIKVSMGDKEISIDYTRLHHADYFTFDELEMMQMVVDPSIANHDSIRVSGFSVPNKTRLPHSMRIRVS